MAPIGYQKARCAIFYTTDEGYLFPTLVSALAVRRQLKPEDAEVRIVFTGQKGKISSLINNYVAERGIILSYMKPEIYNNFDHSKFNKTHVPISAMARFFITDCSPGDYERVVYLDGDTWINDDLAPLINYDPPAGYIAAAEGAAYFYRNDLGPTGDWTREYFKCIGIDGNLGYFNSGVLIARRDTWKNISADAYNFFVNNIEACKYHDESALNAVAHERRVRLSPRWNFVSPYWDWDVDKIVQPAILHFAGGIKPWKERVTPFKQLYDKYQLAHQEMKGLDLDLGKASQETMKTNNNRALAYRLKINTIFLARKLSRRKDMKHIMDTSVC